MPRWGKNKLIDTDLQQKLTDSVSIETDSTREPSSWAESVTSEDDIAHDAGSDADAADSDTPPPMPPVPPPPPLPDQQLMFERISKHLNNIFIGVSHMAYIERFGAMTEGFPYGVDVWRVMSKHFHKYAYGYQFGSTPGTPAWFYTPHNFSQANSAAPPDDIDFSRTPYPCLCWIIPGTDIVWVVCLYIWKANSRPWRAHADRVRMPWSLAARL